MAIDFTSLHLVHTTAGVADVRVERHTYGDLPFELYRPAHGVSATLGAVVFVSGYPDAGLVRFAGKSLKDWTSYIEWARLVAATCGVAAVTYVNREVDDVGVLLAHLRANAAALGLDGARIGVWACSGHGPTALGLLAREALACAALLYPFAIDVDGATAVADAARTMYFAVPPITLDALPRDTPLLVVEAGADATPGLTPALQRFLAATRARGMALEAIEHATAPHAFDLLDDSPRSHEVIEEVLAFIRRTLA